MLKNIKILYAEDEEVSRRNASEILEMLTEQLYVAKDGKEAYELFLEYNPEIVILDIEMPYLNGLEVAQKIRIKSKNTQIILTTAYTDTKYFLKAVELNLVKYIIKPVTIANIKEALSKAYENINFQDKRYIVIRDNLKYDTEERILFFNKEEIKLTHNEMLFFELLLKHINHVVPYEEIEMNIWSFNEEVMTSSALRSLVRDVRKKLPDTKIIENISKTGYKISIVA